MVASYVMISQSERVCNWSLPVVFSGLQVTGVVEDREGTAHYILSGTWDDKMESAKIVDSSQGCGGSECKQKMVYQTLPPKLLWKKYPLPYVSTICNLYPSALLVLFSPVPSFVVWLFFSLRFVLHSTEIMRRTCTFSLPWLWLSMNQRRESHPQTAACGRTSAWWRQDCGMKQTSRNSVWRSVKGWRGREERHKPLRHWRKVRWRKLSPARWYIR